MTVTTLGTSQSYLGNGSTTNWTFPFAMPGGLTPAQASSDLLVTHVDSAGVSHTVAYGTGTNNYQLALVAPVPPNPTGVGGTVTYAPGGSPLPTTDQIIIQRILPAVQSVSLTNQGTLWQQVIEAGLDYLTMAFQEGAFAVISRAIVAPPTDPLGLNYVLPSVATRANEWVGFDGSGNVITGNPPVPPGPQTVSAVWTFTANVLFNGGANFTGTAGAILFNNLTASGTVLFSNTSTATISGSVNFNGPPVQMHTEVDFSGLAVFNGAAQFNAGATFPGGADFTGATGNILFHNLSTDSGGTATFNGPLLCLNTASFNGLTTLSGNTTFQTGTFSFTGATNFSNATTFSAGASFTSGSVNFSALSTSVLFNNFTVVVGGTGLFNGSASFNGSVGLGGTTNFTGGPVTVVTGTSLVVQDAPSLASNQASNTSGGNVAHGIKMSNATNLGLYFGTGAPTFSAAQGSLYMNVGGSSTSTRLYVATNSSGTWTNFVSAT